MDWQWAQVQRIILKGLQTAQSLKHHQVYLSNNLSFATSPHRDVLHKQPADIREFAAGELCAVCINTKNGQLVTIIYFHIHPFAQCLVSE